MVLRQAFAGTEACGTLPTVVLSLSKHLSSLVVWGRIRVSSCAWPPARTERSFVATQDDKRVGLMVTHLATGRSDVTSPLPAV